MLIVYDAPLGLDATDNFYTRYMNTTMGSVIESSASQNAFPIPGRQLRITRGNSQSTHPQA